MKTTQTIVLILFIILLGLPSCGYKSNTEQKTKTENSINIPDSLTLDQKESIKISDSTIDIYTASNKNKTFTYEFWYLGQRQIHRVNYPFFEINYKWIADLDFDGQLEIIRAQGYEDGVNYSIHKKNKDSEELILTFNPVLLDERYPNKLFWGYPWDMENVILKNGQILSTFYDDYNRDDNYLISKEQQRVPFVFFEGKTSQPNATINIDPTQKEYMALNNLVTEAFEPVSNRYQVPNDLYIFQSAKSEVNGLSYKILSLEKLTEKDNNNKGHFALPIVVLLNDVQIELNASIIFAYNDNCPAEGYAGLEIEKNHFTIEQIFCADFLFVHSSTTFRIEDNGEIILYKYREEYTDRSDPNRVIPNKTWTSDNFGKVLFRETTESFLSELRLKKL